MKITEMISTPLEDLKKQKNLDVNIVAGEREWNALFACADLDKIRFFIGKGIDVNHIARDGSTALFHCKTAEKFKIIASRINPELLYHLNNRNQHFVSVIDKESLSFLLNETCFDLDIVLEKNINVKYRNILRSLIGSREQGFYEILKEKITGREMPFSFLNEKEREILYVNSVPNIEMVKLCFEFTPKLYEIFDDKNFEKRDEYFTLIDNKAFHFVNEFKTIFGMVKAQREKELLLGVTINDDEFTKQVKRRI